MLRLADALPDAGVPNLTGAADTVDLASLNEEQSMESKYDLGLTSIAKKCKKLKEVRQDPANKLFFFFNRIKGVLGSFL